MEKGKKTIKKNAASDKNNSIKKTAFKTNFESLEINAGSPITGYTAAYVPNTNTGQVTITFSDGNSPQTFSDLDNKVFDCLINLLSKPNKIFQNGFIIVNG